ELKATAVIGEGAPRGSSRPLGARFAMRHRRTAPPKSPVATVLPSELNAAASGLPSRSNVARGALLVPDARQTTTPPSPTPSSFLPSELTSTDWTGAAGLRRVASDR